MPDEKSLVSLWDYANPNQPQKVEAWIVSLDKARHVPQANAWRPTLVANKEQDADWDWDRLIDEAAQDQREGRGQYQSYALLRGDELQALMLIELVRHVSRISQKPLIYIEYLSVAPSNRRTIQDPPKLGGCGTVIMKKAIEKSLELGYGGTIGLHALPQAVVPYQKMGLKNFGLDPREGLHYFES